MIKKSNRKKYDRQKNKRELQKNSGASVVVSPALMSMEEDAPHAIDEDMEVAEEVTPSAPKRAQSPAATSSNASIQWGLPPWLSFRKLAMAGGFVAVLLLVIVVSSQFNANRVQAVDSLIFDAEDLAASYYYDEAIDLLESSGVDEDHEDVQKCLAAIKEQRAALVKYEGPVYHIFFHSLILDTAKVFDGDYKQDDYNMYFVTRDEFQKMLPLLEANDFILYDLEESVEVGEDGSMTAADIYLPAGKKPLVLSVDDVCYYEYMKDDGFAEALTVNENGEVVTVVRDANGVLQQTFDGDVMPIVDQYVKEHPGFSYRGAKGIVALTGYEGAFGYRITDLEGEELEAARKEVQHVANQLVKSGWKIANHSYTHNQSFTKKTIGMDELKHDTERWKELIAPYVGDTNIYISPFGAYFGEDDPRQQYLYDMGYTVYCPVGRDTAIRYYDDHIVQHRFNIDGYTLIQREDLVQTYFDPDAVLDPSRPELVIV